MSWRLDDPVTLASYVLPIGPTTVDALDRQWATVTAEQPDAGAVVYRGQLQPSYLSLNGTLIDGDEYNALAAWAAKDYPVTLTDDRGVAATVLLTEWTPKRVRKASAPWAHTWTLKALLLSPAGL